MPMNPDVAWAVEDVRKRADPLGLTRAYYDGRHRLTFATDKWRNAFGDLFREFADNLCDDVVDEPVDRLQITNWSAKDTGGLGTLSGRTIDQDGAPVGDLVAEGDDAPEPEDVLGQALVDWWETVKGEARAGVVHRNSHRAGDGFAMLWPDSTGYPRLYVQQPEQMAVRYSTDDPDEPEVFGKVWRAGKVWRCTLYYADRVERYATRGTGAQGGLPAADRFQEYVEVDAEGERQDAVEFHDWGMPCYHFPREGLSCYGTSVLDDVIPLQDALNKCVADMLVAMEFHAMPQRWATGVEVQRDPVTGLEVDPFQAGAGKVWWTQKEGGQFGQFAQADLDGFLQVQTGLRQEIGRKGCLPPTSTGTDGAPTATGQIILEGRLVKRVRNYQRDVTGTWLAIGAQALRMLGKGDVVAADLALEWAPPETRDEKALLEGLVLKQSLGVPKRQLLLEAGYDSGEVRDFLDEGTGNTDEDDAAAVASAMAGGRVSTPTAADLVAAQALGLPPAPEPLSA